MDKQLRVLIVENSDKDVALEVRALKAAGYQVTYVVAVTAAEMKAALAGQAFDIVISDHNLPQFDAPGALAELKQSGQDIPFIIVSGVIGEEMAVALMKDGAHDYVMKNKLARLVPAVQRELREAQSRRERRRAEEALNKAKTLLDKIFASIEDAIFIIDSNTRRINACNQATEVIFGFGEKDLVGCSTEILHVDKLSYDHFGQKLFPALDTNGVFHTEFQMRRKNGSVFPTENRVTEILDDSGHRTSVVCVVRDITERKKMEEKLREHDIQLTKLTSWVPGMMYQFTKRPDGTFCIPFTTEAVKDIFGCSPEDIREDFSSIARVILPEDLDKLVDSIEYSAKHMTIWTLEYRVQIPGQPIRWILGKSTPEKLADGSITWHGFNTDITEQKMLRRRCGRVKRNSVLLLSPCRKSSGSPGKTAGIFISISNG